MASESEHRLLLAALGHMSGYVPQAVREEWLRRLARLRRLQSPQWDWTILTGDVPHDSAARQQEIKALLALSQRPPRRGRPARTPSLREQYAVLLALFSMPGTTQSLPVFHYCIKSCQRNGVLSPEVNFTRHVSGLYLKHSAKPGRLAIRLLQINTGETVKSIQRKIR